MKLITKPIERELRVNFATNLINRNSGKDCLDFQPVVKLFCPWGAATWLFSEFDGQDFFGLCDLGMGSPEMGYASLAEIQSIKHFSGLRIERDAHFTPKMTLRGYADNAHITGRIDA